MATATQQEREQEQERERERERDALAWMALGTHLGWLMLGCPAADEPADLLLPVREQQREPEDLEIG